MASAQTVACKEDAVADRSLLHFDDLRRDWPQLFQGAVTLLEVCCGRLGGCSIVQEVLHANPSAKGWLVCDRWTEALQQSQLQLGGRLHAWVANAARDDLSRHVPAGSVDWVVMRGVLSSLRPTEQLAALTNVARTLCASTGRVLFLDRCTKLDSGADTLEQCARSRRLGERLTVHPDGSCDYLFQPEEVRTLFAAARLRCVELHTQHTQHPRHRLWLRGTFQLDTAAGGGTLQGRNDGCGEMMQGVTSLTQACPPSKQQQQSTSMPPRRVAPGLLSGTWLTGAAGRLALHASELPGLPSGRALLPETLDSADEEASALSPARYYDAGATPSGGAGALAATRWRQQQQQIEAQVEKEFFEVINRDTQEVVEEEVGLARGANSLLLEVPLLPDLTHAAECTDNSLAQPSSR